MSSRKRKPNWTDQECLLLAQLMQERKDIVRGKCSTGVSIEDKRQAWEEIAQAINTAFPQVQRTVSDCNKKWENLLAKSREEIKRQRRQASTDGLSHEQFSTVTQVVISVMNLSDMLQQDRDDSSISELAETQQDRLWSNSSFVCTRHPGTRMTVKMKEFIMFGSSLYLITTSESQTDKLLQYSIIKTVMNQI
ncbi:myb/SANT-like DNA-binding domain-containing protein 4 isoform X2 [Micropterus salmoides]|uniref:myb/SANT-like DNA-binding domain-containing protein 4 isoform X2 n=1 Tax=Micropterus salmoides TaxID=27706 RepID=UPI0018EAEE14|nr:myb/SANT-like DNA-binding domain-containing protein 4 isoform X2 [Micropterus salmoides]